MNFFESHEFDFAQASQSVRDRSVLIFYTQIFFGVVLIRGKKKRLRGAKISVENLRGAKISVEN